MSQQADKSDLVIQNKVKFLKAEEHLLTGSMQADLPGFPYCLWLTLLPQVSRTLQDPLAVRPKL